MVASLCAIRWESYNVVTIYYRMRGDWLGVDTETDDQLLQLAAVNTMQYCESETQFNIIFWVCNFGHLCDVYTLTKQHRATGTLGDGNISNGIMLLRDTSIPFQAKSKNTHPHICC